MLNRRDRGPVAIAKHGTERDARDPLLVGSDLDPVSIMVGNLEA
jgi:hypothetical protein